jgi:hypothetical protein
MIHYRFEPFCAWRHPPVGRRRSKTAAKRGELYLGSPESHNGCLLYGILSGEFFATEWRLLWRRIVVNAIAQEIDLCIGGIRRRTVVIDDSSSAAGVKFPRLIGNRSRPLAAHRLLFGSPIMNHPMLGGAAAIFALSLAPFACSLR